MLTQTRLKEISQFFSPDLFIENREEKLGWEVKKRQIASRYVKRNLVIGALISALHLPLDAFAHVSNLNLFITLRLLVALILLVVAMGEKRSIFKFKHYDLFFSAIILIPSLAQGICLSVEPRLPSIFSVLVSFIVSSFLFTNLLFKISQYLIGIMIQVPFLIHHIQGDEIHNLLSVGLLCLAGLAFFGYIYSRELERFILERQVDQKNDQLQNKTQALESALLKLKSAQAELVQSAKLASLGTLSAGIAHEINNSLNYVCGSLKPLEKLINQGMSQDYKQRTDRLLKMMNEGLTLTVDIIQSLKNHSGLNQAKFNDLRLIEILDTVQTLLRSNLRERIAVVCEIEPDLIIHGNVIGLNQVFMNLISNAIDAMPDGGELRITAHPKGELIEIEVADTGTGMPEEVRQRIFEPFYTTKEVGKGTGLGLHIVKNEINLHGGSISVESQLGIGTKFRITLPIKHEEK